MLAFLHEKFVGDLHHAHVVEVGRAGRIAAVGRPAVTEPQRADDLGSPVVLRKEVEMERRPVPEVGAVEEFRGAPELLLGHVEQDGAAPLVLRNVRIFDLGIHAVHLVGFQPRKLLFDAHAATAVLGELLDLDAAAVVDAGTLDHLDRHLAAVVEIDARPAFEPLFEAAVDDLDGIGIHDGRFGPGLAVTVAAARPKRRGRQDYAQKESHFFHNRYI